MTIELDHCIVPSRNKAASPQYGNVYWNEPDGPQWEMLTTSYARPPGHRA